MCLFVCEHISGTAGLIFSKFFSRSPWTWLGNPLASLRYVMYFQFYGMTPHLDVMGATLKRGGCTMQRQPGVVWWYWGGFWCLWMLVWLFLCHSSHWVATTSASQLRLSTTSFLTAKFAISDLAIVLKHLRFPVLYYTSCTHTWQSLAGLLGLYIVPAGGRLAQCVACLTQLTQMNTQMKNLHINQFTSKGCHCQAALINTEALHLHCNRLQAINIYFSAS